MFWEEQQSQDSHPKVVEGEKLIERGDVGEAMQMWEELALSGEIEVQVRLGLVFAEGEVVPHDYSKAAYWWEKAAYKGNAEAMVYLGHCFFEGQGMDQDEIWAFVMFSLAAERGHPKGIQFRQQGQRALSREELNRATDLIVQEQIKILQNSIEYPVYHPKDLSGVTYRIGFHDMHVRKAGRPYFLVDVEKNVRVLLQDFSDKDGMHYEGKTKNCLADGEGKAVLSRGKRDDYPARWEGVFRNGVYLGPDPFSFPIQVLEEGDFLIDISGEITDPGTVWVYKGLSSIGPLELSFHGLPQIYVVVPDDFSMLNEEVVKERMLLPGDCVKAVCQDVQGYDVKILPEGYGVQKGQNPYQTAFKPILARGTVVFTPGGDKDLRGYEIPQAVDEKARAKKAQREVGRN